jgi:MFS family permease
MFVQTPVSQTGHTRDRKVKEAMRKNYLLTILMVVLTFNSVDRSFLGLVLQNIKADLSLSDTQLGFLSGIAFALIYAIMNIPVARWADRGNRVTIITIATVLSSAAVALCGAACTFSQLLLIRIGVAVGEGGSVPPAHSLIADYFTRSERPRAVTRYMLGYPLSLVIGFFAGGWLNEFYGWRATFIMLGLPGLALAGWAWFSLREPRRVNPAMGVAGKVSPSTLSQLGAMALSVSSPSVKEVSMALWANTTFRQLLFSVSVNAFFAYGIVQWLPAFFIRSYGLTTGELGTWLAAIQGLGGLVGYYLGGEWASRYAANNECLQLKAIAFVTAGFGIVSAFIYLSPNLHMAFGLLVVATVGGLTINGPLFALIQTLVPQRMRATAVAVIFLFTNLIGGLGPWAAGALSDALRPLMGEESLRYSLMALCPGYFWSAYHFWRGSKTVAHDVEAAYPITDSTFPQDTVAWPDRLCRSSPEI